MTGQFGHILRHGPLKFKAAFVAKIFEIHVLLPNVLNVLANISLKLSFNAIKKVVIIHCGEVQYNNQVFSFVS